MSNQEIQILDHIQHVRKRPDMYIGDNNDPTHLCQEVLDNALDELLNKHADSISIDYDNNGNITIIDNGRGFPVHDVVLPNGETSDSVIGAIGHLFSGSKFDTDTYGKSKGKNGVGLSVVNALSDSLTMMIKDRKDPKIIYKYEFDNGKFKNKEIQNLPKPAEFSTAVQFKVGTDYFKSLNIRFELINKELTLVSAKYPNASIRVNNKKIPSKNMEGYVRWMLKIPASVPVFKSIAETRYGEKVEVYYTFHNSNVSYGDVNLGICDGLYLNSFGTIFHNCCKTHFDDSLTKAEVISNFKYYISLEIKEPKYDSQNKVRMIKNVSYLFDELKGSIDKNLGKDHLKQHINAILDSKKIKIASKVLKNNRNRVSSDNPLKDCVNIPGKILYILEGDSASGTLKDIRDVKTEAILPVDGKIINSIKFGIDKAVNTKLKYLLEAIGIDPSKKQNKYRYESVKVICDADPDGLHIATLISISIWKFAPEIIINNKFSIIFPPLYGATESKTNKFIPIYNDEDLKPYLNNSKYHINRFKGLGEMNPKQLKEVILNPIEYFAKMPQTDTEDQIVYKLMTDSEIKRQICNDDRFSFKSMINLCS